MRMGKIQVLSEAIAQKIAAGEVVERPASVVKELMENAIDAGASEIIVELKSGGLQLIRVIDNGEGMVAEDVPLALQRYATSKIRKAEDLYAIETMGFRGEALPSIASVSRMVLKTRPFQTMAGTQLVAEGGQIRSLSEIGCPVGTEVEVRDLFYNLPVRRKFLRSIRTELRYGLLLFHRVSLAYPSIAFKFIHEGRRLEELFKTESLLVRIEAILGKGISDHLIPLRSEEGDYRIEGFTGLPSLARGNREAISIYINRRYVKDRILSRAITEAYRHILPSDKFPVTVLFIGLPASMVDVNVHPAKAEVKFREPERLYQAVLASVRRALEEVPSLKKEVSREAEKGFFLGRGNQDSFSFRNIQKSYSAYQSEGIDLLRVREGQGVEWEGEKERPYRIVGQLWGTYILCESKGTLLFVDQHAAHERILYEKMRKDYEKGALVTEKLLLPVLIELSLEESLVLESAQEAFESIGFEIESVGERLYAIRSIPSLIGPKEAEGRVREILEELSFLKRGGEGVAWLQALLISLSCHSAIRANFPLRKEEMEELIQNLYPFHPSTTCPHGRPVFFLIPLDELNRKFKRN